MCRFLLIAAFCFMPVLACADAIEDECSKYDPVKSSDYKSHYKCVMAYLQDGNRKITFDDCRRYFGRKQANRIDCYDVSLAQDGIVAAPAPVVAPSRSYLNEPPLPMPFTELAKQRLEERKVELLEQQVINEQNFYNHIIDQTYSSEP